LTIHRRARSRPAVGTYLAFTFSIPMPCPPRWRLEFHCVVGVAGG